MDPLPGLDLADVVEQRRVSTALAGWSPGDLDALRGVVEHAQCLLETVSRTCLVHSDLNSKNLLVDSVSLEVTGVVDWEFAHAGSPVTDLGNLMRLDRDGAYVAGVLEAFRGGVVDAGDDALDLARAADLPALVDLAGRRGENPVTEQAHDLLLAIARQGDLHAVPPSGAGLDRPGPVA